MPLKNKKKLLAYVQFRHAFQNLTGSKDNFYMFRWFSLSLWSHCFRLAWNSLCRHCWFWTHRNLPISNSSALGLKTCNTTSGHMFSYSSSPCLLVFTPWPWEALKSRGGVFVKYRRPGKSLWDYVFYIGQESCMHQCSTTWLTKHHQPKANTSWDVDTSRGNSILFHPQMKSYNWPMASERGRMRLLQGQALT